MALASWSGHMQAILDIQGLEGALVRLAERLEALEAGDQSPWLTVEGAAAYLSTSPDGIRAAVKRQQIPSHRVNGRRLFDRAELDAWVRGGDVA
jgi:excisionase family DNA binding protein